MSRGRPGTRSRWLLAAILLALPLSGCIGFLRPMMTGEGRDFYLLLSGRTMGEPETLIYLSRSGPGGPWELVGDRAGMVRAAAAWRGELWCFTADACVALQPRGAELASRVVPWKAPFPVQAAVVHGGDLWILGIDDGALVALRRGPDSQRWEPAPGGLDLGRGAARLQAASSGGSLWLLWRKADEGGRTMSETFSARYADGSWTLGAARALGDRELVVAADPAGGGGVLVLAERKETDSGSGSARRREMVLCRLGESGWDEPEAVGVDPRELGSALFSPALLAGDSAEDGEPARLAAVVGRRDGFSVWDCEVEPDGRPGPWAEAQRVRIRIYGPEMLLAAALLLAAVAVGLGFGIAFVRRRRLFPFPPESPAPAHLTLRAAAWLFDNLLLSSVFLAVVAGFNLRPEDLWRSGGLLAVAAGSNRILFMFYAWIFEARWGTTPGKMTFDLCVADEDGLRPSAKAALVRNLMRFLDEATFLPLPGLLTAMLTWRAQRLGDLAAHTVVTTKRSFLEAAEDRHRKSDRFGRPDGS